MVSTAGHLERFLRAVHNVHATGAAVPETSYYPSISRLLEDVGVTLTPQVRPVINIRNSGSGIPDGGLFVVRPSGPVHTVDPMVASLPERGAIEVKPPDGEMDSICSGANARRARGSTTHRAAPDKQVRWALPNK